LDSRYAYAHTLLGHEFVLTEELEKGLQSFRTAAGLDPRNYNACYGIGLIFYKQVSNFFIVKGALP
jgi:anaphase-promoting complex subunit 3